MHLFNNNIDFITIININSSILFFTLALKIKKEILNPNVGVKNIVEKYLLTSELKILFL